MSLVLKSEIIKRQKEYLIEEASLYLPNSATEEEVYQLADEMFYKYQLTLGKPLFEAREAVYGEVPFKEDYYNNNKEIDKDLEVLFNELNLIAAYLVDYFNYSQSEKDRLLNQINGINGSVNDLHLLTEEVTSDTVFFKESFSNHNLIDTSITDEENRAMLHTKEGVLTLRRVAAVNRSLDAFVRTVEGNGSPGTYHISRKIDSETEFDNYELLSDQLPNDIPGTMIEGDPDSVYEYQMINVPEEEKRKRMFYDFEWTSGKEHGDLLRMKFIMQFHKPEEINWINLRPFHAPNGPGSLHVHSIRTSVDGINYVGLYEEDGLHLNQQINETPQSYRAEDIFDGSEDFANTKFTGQGVWSFPTRKAKYVEFVLEQPNSYGEEFGQECYYRRKVGAESWQRIRKQEVPSHIIDEKYGIHRIDSDYEIKKELEVIKGWRYSIGIRDIQLMSFVFDETSEYVSKPFKVENGIRHLALYSNEKIPNEYKDRVGESNDWIQYYISFDDIDWYRISPQHHQPVNDEFPPKIISVNDNTADVENIFSVYKRNINTNEDPTQVRLKIVMKRPNPEDEETLDKIKHTTPFVEDYALKIVTNKKGV